MKRLGTLSVISGPSGVGKSSLLKKVLPRLPQVEFSISCTTRAPRPGEVNGRDYYFLTEAEYDAKLAAGEFLEHAEIFSHRYGTLKSEVIRRLERGVLVILDIDVQGAAQIREAAKSDAIIRAAASTVMIAPPDLAALRRRLEGRNTETAAQLSLRLAAASRELSCYPDYDYLVVNDDLDTAAEQLYQVLCAMRLKSANILGDPFHE